MENLGENTYKPGIIGALTTIYLGLEQESAALKLFEKSVTWYKKNRVGISTYNEAKMFLTLLCR